MEKPNLPSELREHRERHGLSTQQMADKFHVSKHDYERVESGSATLSPEEENRFRKLLDLEKAGLPVIRKWYQSKSWHGPIPIVICIVVFGLLSQLNGYRSGLGQNDGASLPIRSITVISLVFCGCYWYFWPPELPFKSGKNRKNH